MTEITVRLSEEDRRAIVEEIVSKLAERQDTSSPWMKVKEAAAYAQISVRTLKDWTREGRVRRYGQKHALYRRDHLDEDLTRWRS